MKKLFLILFLLYNTAKAQTLIDTGNHRDSTQILENIIINAYENNRKLIDVPAAVSLVNSADLNRYNNTSVLSAMNASPGVRMDERSPGSYRLSIRGSSLRSPFGVRNVKIYYDGIPFTDPGGNTYLNQLGFYNIQSVEVIKGPGGSLYGAGTGGVLLINNDAGKFTPGVSVAYNTGSYNLQNINVNVRLGKESAHNIINYQHQSSDGYRDHTASRRDVFTWDGVLKATDQSKLQAHFLYGDLYYQTPGALTKKEYDLNAKSARPVVGAMPSADQAQAAIFQKTFLAGFSFEQKINENWKNTTTLYGAYAQVRNPNFRNFSRTSEPHLGGRTLFQFKKQLSTLLLTVNAGAEMQQSFNVQRIYNNKNGQTDSLQTDDEINNNQGFIFLQGNADLSSGWTFTLGASFNKYTIDFKRASVLPPFSYNKNFNDQLTPRLAILKKLNNYISAYASVARGFSAPTTAELLPSINVFNTALQAESGVDYEFGTRGSVIRNKLYFDVNAFFYKLKNAIVQRRDASGADYFENAGSANQNGLETLVTFELINNERQSVNHVFLHASNTWNNFRYDQFKQLTNDYSGNKLPGVASQTVAAGVDASMKIGLYANVTYFFSGPIQLNDANTAKADSYNLLGLRIGYKQRSKKRMQFEIFGGGENMLNEKYSLGNDINAAGGRYYNAAAGRNFYAGIILNYTKNAGNPL
jgi:iron complex outermembrane receptor protein